MLQESVCSVINTVLDKSVILFICMYMNYLSSIVLIVSSQYKVAI